MNTISIVGNLGQDARHVTTNGADFVSFSVADTERWKDASGEVKDRTTWYNVITSQKNLLPYLKKGTKVFVSGRLRCSVYRSEKDGQPRADLTVNAFAISLESAKKDDQNQQPTEAPSENSDEKDLPF